ncbi:MAG: S8 family serine peptidase, partial [Glaciecola sp.]
LVGNSKDYAVLLKNVDVFAASVFFDDGVNGQITTTESLIKALDWLVSEDVKVINMSLAGPPNNILSAAIDKFCQQGVIIVAAVGNNGPHAKPLFPASYDCVIGVTAISQNNQVYRRAGRGEQVDFASYGVNVRAADFDNGYSNVTGTSFATPFVTAQIVSLLPAEPLNAASQQTLIEQLITFTVDLGEPGKDDIYGFGALIQANDVALQN